MSFSEIASPFRMLEISHAFDEEDTRAEQHQGKTQEDKGIRKSTTFGVEWERKMSVDPSLQNKIVVIEEDREGEYGLVRRLRNVKRRLFLDCIATSPTKEQAVANPRIMFPTPIGETPIHANRSSSTKTNADTMEGTEVVLEDLSSNAFSAPPNDTDYLSFSSSYLQSWNEEEEPKQTAVKPAPHKGLSSDSSVATEVTAACSICECDDHDQINDDNCDPHWISLSSISEIQ